MIFSNYKRRFTFDSAFFPHGFPDTIAKSQWKDLLNYDLHPDLMSWRQVTWCQWASGGPGNRVQAQLVNNSLKPWHNFQPWRHPLAQQTPGAHSHSSADGRNYWTISRKEIMLKRQDSHLSSLMIDLEDKVIWKHSVLIFGEWVWVIFDDRLPPEEGLTYNHLPSQRSF